MDDVDIMEYKMTNNVMYPQLRDEIVLAINDLSDRDWIKKFYDNNLASEDFDIPFHTIFDDTSLGSDPYGCVGYYLKNKKEADAISELLVALEEILEKYGPLMTYQQAYEDPNWERVIDRAHAALVAMKQT